MAFKCSLGHVHISPDWDDMRRGALSAWVEGLPHEACRVDGRRCVDQVVAAHAHYLATGEVTPLD